MAGSSPMDGRLLQRVLDAVPDNVAVIGPDGTIRHVNYAWLSFAHANKADMCTVSPGVNYFATCERAIEAGSPDAVYAHDALVGLRDVLNGDRNLLRSDYPCHSNTERRWFTLRAARMRIDDTPFCLASHADISPLKEAEVALSTALRAAQTADHAKSAFLAGMSHEFRTPLNSILGFSSLINDEIYGPLGNDKYREYIQLILTSGQRLLGLLDGVLDLTRIEQGTMEHNDELLDVGAEIASVIDSYPPGIIDETHKKVSVSGTGSPYRLRADRAAFWRITENLVSNALKYTGEQADIVVSWSVDDGGEGILAVTDDGQGIEPEFIENVTQPFVQLTGRLDATPYIANEDAGMGLGLHIVSCLVATHGGRIEIDSELDRGTTVNIIFPANRIVGPSQ